MRDSLDARVGFLARHAEVRLGQVDMETALDWWNRGWVIPISFEPMMWRITSDGWLALHPNEDHRPLDFADTDVSARTIEWPETRAHRSRELKFDQ